MISGGIVIGIGALGLIGLAIKSPKAGILYIVLGIVAIIPVVVFCMGEMKGKASDAAALIFLIPVLIATILWIIGGIKKLKSVKKQ